MGHRAAVYTVRVHQRGKPDDSRIFGDIDIQGTSLISKFEKFTEDFESISQDKTRVVRNLSTEVAGDELRLILQHGQNGLAADIVDNVGQLRIHQEASDTQRVRCACLFQLPRLETNGWLAVHINNNRYVKGLLAQGLQARFRADFPDLILEITPYVLGSVLRQAVDQDRVEKVTLVKLERPNDRANAATDKWVRSPMGARVELTIEPRGRKEHLIPDLLKRFLGGDSAVYPEIVAYEGLMFDEAKVQVTLEDGFTRTFNIERPEVGHAFTEDLRNLDLEADGEPTEASLFARLRAALSTVTA